MKMDQPTRDEQRTPNEAGRGTERMRNGEPRPADREFERERKPQDDLILHDDDEAELELPR